MNLPLAIFGLGTWETILILFVIVLLFGAKRLPELARSLGQAKKEFQKGSKEAEEEDKKKSIPSSNGNSH